MIERQNEPAMPFANGQSNQMAMCMYKLWDREINKNQARNFWNQKENYPKRHEQMQRKQLQKSCNRLFAIFLPCNCRLHSNTHAQKGAPHSFFPPHPIPSRIALHIYTVLCCSVLYCTVYRVLYYVVFHLQHKMITFTCVTFSNGFSQRSFLLLVSSNFQNT